MHRVEKTASHGIIHLVRWGNGSPFSSLLDFVDITGIG